MRITSILVTAGILFIAPACQSGFPDEGVELHLAPAAERLAKAEAEAQKARDEAAAYRARQVAPAAGVISVSPGNVIHVVIVWLKQPGDAAAREAVIRSGDELKTIPGVLGITAGPVLPSDRPVVDSTYDVGVVTVFRDAQAMEDYAAHPTHQKVLKEVVRPIVDHYKVYDFVVP